MMNCFDVPFRKSDAEWGRNISDLDFIYKFRKEFELPIAIFCNIDSRICTLYGEFIGVAENVGDYCGKGFLVTSINRSSYFIPCSAEEINSVRELAENEDVWNWSYIDENGIKRSMTRLNLFPIYTENDRTMVLHERMKLPPVFFLLFKAISEGKITPLGCAYMSSDDIPPGCVDFEDLLLSENDKFHDIFNKVVPEYLLNECYNERPEVYVLCDVNDYVFSARAFASPLEDFKESAFIQRSIVSYSPGYPISYRVYPIYGDLMNEADEYNPYCDIIFVHDSIVERIASEERKVPDLVKLFISATREQRGILIVADGKQIDIDSLMRECPKREVKSNRELLNDILARVGLPEIQA